MCCLVARLIMGCMDDLYSCAKIFTRKRDCGWDAGTRSAITALSGDIENEISYSVTLVMKLIFSLTGAGKAWRPLAVVPGCDCGEFFAVLLEPLLGWSSSFSYSDPVPLEPFCATILCCSVTVFMTIFCCMSCENQENQLLFVASRPCWNCFLVFLPQFASQGTVPYREHLGMSSPLVTQV